MEARVLDGSRSLHAVLATKARNGVCCRRTNACHRHSQQDLTNYQAAQLPYRSWCHLNLLPAAQQVLLPVDP